ncbi:Ribosomal large subunit pseudouridine synthase D [Hypsizygus marmoreus]|uniref:21S rRNA pseudouridine(2819) synthase n=1 Tax=Hypsizygus marmoreus TaxID=39966 RepID=A0A369J6K7_HYPMA|nr:Ribosomal large subunit pseudouridine synthase D [Hypsizygus marmoreus]
MFAPFGPVLVLPIGMNPTLSLRTLKAGRTAIPRNPALYVDRGIVVLNKPAGIVCQFQSTERGKPIPTEVRKDGYDLNGLLIGLQEALPLDRRPFPVHRLDKGTTGALVFARSLSQAHELSKQFQTGTVEKTYLALVRGGVKSFPDSHGRIDSPIQYCDGRASLDDSHDSKPSITEWELVNYSPNAPLSLLRFKLLTGHKHQLRVHAAHCLNAPILGDTLYSTKPVSDAITRITKIPVDRIFLHSSQLSLFRYRPTGPRKRFRLGISAPLPEDFLKICIDAGIKVDPVEAKGGLTINGKLVEDGIVPEIDGHWIPNDERSRE